MADVDESGRIVSFSLVVYLPKYGKSSTADCSPPTIFWLGADCTTEAVAASAATVKRIEEEKFVIVVVIVVVVVVVVIPVPVPVAVAILLAVVVCCC